MRPPDWRPLGERAIGSTTVVIIALLAGAAGCSRVSKAQPKRVDVLAAEPAEVFALAGDEKFLCWALSDAVRCVARSGGPPRTFPGSRAHIAVHAGRLVKLTSDLVVVDLESGVERTWAKRLEANHVVADASGAYVLGWVGDRVGAEAKSGLLHVREDGAIEHLAALDFAWIAYSAPSERQRDGQPPIALDDDAIYYVEKIRGSGQERLRRRSKHDGTDTVLHTEPIGLHALHAAAGFLYFAHPGGLCRVPSRGGAVERLEDAIIGSTYVVNGDSVLSRTHNDDPPNAAGYYHNELGADAKACPLRPTIFNRCRSFFADAHGAGIVGTTDGFFTFREPTRGKGWQLVRTVVR
ncbi:MAG: hypothetical protein K0S65_5294, partial [Labilithrix sp.]|nr:hypothetical protein [Labilithrix sp.]